MSGTMVERRDHVFTTFFSFRVFSPSTFSRRWPSTNGPFFSERAIDSLFLHAAQADPLRSPHLFEAAHRTWYPVRFRTERAYEARALRVRNAFHDHAPSGLAQLVQHRLRRRRHNFYRAHRLAALDRGAFRWRPLYGASRPLGHPAQRRSPGSPACVASCSCCSCRSHRLRSHRTALPSPSGSRICCFVSRFSLLASNRLLPSLHNLPVGTLVVPRLLAERREGPRRLRVIALDLAFTTAVRVIDRVHGHAAHGGLHAVPPCAPGLAVGFILMIEIANLANRRHAIHGKLAHFARGHLHQREIALFAEQLRRAA